MRNNLYPFTGNFRKLACLAVVAMSLGTLTGCSDSSSTTTTSSTAYTLGFATPVSKTLSSGTGGASTGQIVTAADFDQDGKADFAVVNPTDSTVSVFRSNGTGFDAEVIDSTVANPIAIATADFNKDGKPDLAVLSATGISIMLNDGSGHFTTHVDLAAGTANTALTTADFNNDGFPDVAIVDSGTTQLHILFSDGSSTPANYTLDDFATTAGTINGPTSVAAADFNQDGFIDLVISNGNASYVTAWTNAGSGTLFPSGNTQNSSLDQASGNGGYGIAAGDLNGDGRPDIVTSATGSAGPEFRAFLNTASGIGIVSGGEQVTNSDPSSVLLADFNGDGIVDIGIVSRSGASADGTGAVDIFTGDGTGAFSTGASFVGPTAQTYAAGAIGDFDGDGKTDVVLAGPGAAVILYNAYTVTAASN